TPISASITSAIPSAAKVKLIPQCGIHGYDSRNCSRSPPTSKAAQVKPANASTPSDQPKATRLANSGRLRGSSATTTAPTSGATTSTDRYGNSLTVQTTRLG